MKRLTATKPIENMITTSGRIFIPGVSSSKKRRRPALAAGMGASRLRLFSRAEDKDLASYNRCISNNQLNFDSTPSVAR